MEFKKHIVNARKDLLHLVEENVSPKRNIYQEIGKEPKKWIGELNMISQMLTNQRLIGFSARFNPPTNESEFKKIGENTFFYRGQQTQQRGLWIKKENKTLEKMAFHEWTHYIMGTSARLFINEDFSNIPIETFLPKNIEQQGKEIQKAYLNTRSIFKVQIKEDEFFFAKGSSITLGTYNDKPWYRLTSIGSINKDSSSREKDITLIFSNQGIKMPKVIGYYESLVEDFLFVKEVLGKTPNKYLQTHKGEIIQQDAEMLANICLTGYRKQRFEDFDDKIFNGKDLYLIDVDECMDLYPPNYSGDKIDFRYILLNPNNTKVLDNFREYQKGTFKHTLKDVLFNYQKTLTPDFDDKANYIKTFYNKVGWSEPNSEEIQKLITFEKDYCTIDSCLAMGGDD